MNEWGWAHDFLCTRRVFGQYSIEMMGMRGAVYSMIMMS